MAKIYPTERNKTTGTEEGGPVRKTFGMYDRPVKASRAMMIALIIAAVLLLIVIAWVLLR